MLSQKALCYVRNFHRKRERGKKNRLVFRWTQIYSEMNHKCHALQELCPESSFSCPCRASDFVVQCVRVALSDIPLESSGRFQGDFGEISPTSGTLFVFCCSSSWVFHLGGGKKKKSSPPVIVLAGKINVCVCIHGYRGRRWGVCV